MGARFTHTWLQTDILATVMVLGISEFGWIRLSHIQKSVKTWALWKLKEQLSTSPCSSGIELVAGKFFKVLRHTINSSTIQCIWLCYRSTHTFEHPLFYFWWMYCNYFPCTKLDTKIDKILYLWKYVYMLTFLVLSISFYQNIWKKQLFFTCLSRGGFKIYKNWWQHLQSMEHLQVF